MMIHVTWAEFDSSCFCCNLMKWTNELYFEHFVAYCLCAYCLHFDCFCYLKNNIWRECIQWNCGECKKNETVSFCLLWCASITKPNNKTKNQQLWSKCEREEENQRHNRCNVKCKCGLFAGWEFPSNRCAMPLSTYTRKTMTMTTTTATTTTMRAREKPASNRNG